MRSFPLISSGFAALVSIQQGARTIRFSTADRVLIIDGVTWPQGPGAKITSWQFPSDGTPGNADISIMANEGGVIELGDGAAGLLDDWPIEIDLIDPNVPSISYPLLVGTVGSVTEDAFGNCVIAANGQLRLAQNAPLCEHFTLTGREDLGDDRCKIPILLDRLGNPTAYDIGRNQTFQSATDLPLLHVADGFGRVKTGSFGDVRDYANVSYQCIAGGVTAAVAPTYDPTIGNITVDGSAHFQAVNAWTRYAFGKALTPFTIQLTALPDSRASDDTWFINGGLHVRSGVLANTRKMPIRAWDHSALVVTLFLPIAVQDVPTGTQFEIHVGCDLTPDQCLARFNNIINIRAEYFVPPPETQFSL